MHAALQREHVRELNESAEQMHLKALIHDGVQQDEAATMLRKRADAVEGHGKAAETAQPPDNFDPIWIYHSGRRALFLALDMLRNGGDIVPMIDSLNPHHVERVRVRERRTGRWRS